MYIYWDGRIIAQTDGEPLIATILWTVFYYLISRQKIVGIKGNNFVAVAYVKQRIIYFSEF
jgi:hypothetical protein